MINHCDRRITLLSDTDIFFGLFNLFTYLDMPFVSNTLKCKRNFEEIFYVCYNDLSSYVFDNCK